MASNYNAFETSESTGFKVLEQLHFYATQAAVINIREHDDAGAIAATIACPVNESVHITFEPPLYFDNDLGRKFYLDIDAGTGNGSVVGKT